jgi:hypothetical protein
MIAMAIPGGQSPNDFNFSVKTQAKSALEILVLAMLAPYPGLKGLAKYDRWQRCVSNAPQMLRKILSGPVPDLNSVKLRSWGQQA